MLRLNTCTPTVSNLIPGLIKVKQLSNRLLRHKKLVSYSPFYCVRKVINCVYMSCKYINPTSIVLQSHSVHEISFTMRSKRNLFWLFAWMSILAVAVTVKASIDSEKSFGEMVRAILSITRVLELT